MKGYNKLTIGKIKQIGGKGSVRKKKAVKRRKPQINKEEQQLKKIIDDINTKVLKLDLHNYKMSISWYMRALEEVIIQSLD